MTNPDRYWPVHYTAEYAEVCLTCTRPECDYGPGCPWHLNSASIHPPTPQTRATRLADARAYYHAHHEKCDARQRTWRQTHREEYNARMRAYHDAHRDRINAQARARRAAAVGAGPCACPPPEEAHDDLD
jgi:hypothetical protein